MSTLIETLKTLSNIPGISGAETEVRRKIKELVADYVDEMRVDGVGNLITYKKGTGDCDITLLITAHTDEVGLMVVDHNSDGTLGIGSVGSIPSRLLPGLHVRVGKDALPGIIGIPAIHRDHNFSKAPSIDRLAVDIGAKSKDNAKGLAPLGTPIVFATEAHEIGDLLAGKAFDDRAGCAILIGLLQAERLPCNLYGVFTVQEEVGLRGARVAAYTTNPDYAFSLEGTLADDLPKEEKDASPTSEIGKGPAVTVYDRSYMTPPRLLKYIAETGTENGIPFQFKQPGISGTEAGATHKARGGVPAITIAVPCRYIHSPISLMHPDDIQHTFDLVYAAAQHLDRIPDASGK